MQRFFLAGLDLKCCNEYAGELAALFEVDNISLTRIFKSQQKQRCPVYILQGVIRRTCLKKLLNKRAKFFLLF